ncbi:hypothetical protein UT4_16050 [Ferrigenium sp. UT4]
MLKLWFVANTLLWPFNVDAGGLKLGLNVILLTLVGTVWLLKNQRFSGYSVNVLSGLFIFLIFSYLAAITGICTDKFLKFALTAPVFIFLIFVGLEVGWRSTDNDWLNLQKVSQWVLLVAFAGFIIEALLPGSFPLQAGSRSEGKFSGLFAEPSHVAFSLFPSIAILLVAESKPMRRKGILALVSLLLFSRSSTLIALIVVWVSYRMFAQGKFRQVLLAVPAMALIVALGAMVDYDRFVGPTLERVAGVVGASETQNMSSLVYLQGWQDAWNNLLRTEGLGLGFNMMGCTPLPDVQARDILSSVMHIELNSEDGSHLFGKIVSEAGIFGILFFIVIIWWWIRIEKKFRKYGLNKTTAAISIQMALIFTFIAPAFIRSPGYFSGGFLLMIVAVSASAKWRRECIARDVANRGGVQ